MVTLNFRRWINLTIEDVDGATFGKWHLVMCLQ